MILSPNLYLYWLFEISLTKHIIVGALVQKKQLLIVTSAGRIMYQPHSAT